MPRKKLHSYASFPCPAYTDADTADLGGQVCSCGHDRLNHSHYIGEGQDREFIPRPVSVGTCRIGNCNCPFFTFSFTRSSQHGQAAHQREVSLNTTANFIPTEGVPVQVRTIGKKDIVKSSFPKGQPAAGEKPVVRTNRARTSRR